MTPYQKYAAQVVFWLIILPLLTIFCVCKYIDTLFPPAHGQGFSDASAPFLLSTSSLRKGLVGYWRLEEASGTRYDCSSTGAHLSDSNTCGQVTAKVGYGSTFLASGSKFLAATSSNKIQFSLSQPFTFAAWCKPTNNATAQLIATHFDNTAVRGVSFAIQSTGQPSLSLYSSGSAYRYNIGATVITDGTWRLIVGTYDGSGSQNGINLYVNNVSEAPGRAGAGSMTDLNNAGVFELGGSTASTSACYNGALDEVGVWNRVLSAAELTQLYNSGNGTHFPWAHR